MWIRRCRALVAGLSFLACCLPGPRAPAAAGSGAGEAAILVAFHAAAPAEARARAIRRARLAPDLAARSPHFARLRGAAAGTPTALADLLGRLRRDPAVRVAEPDYRIHLAAVPDDPLFPDQWSLLNTGQEGGAEGADIRAPSAWELAIGGDVRVAVIDTGTDYNHPDLADNMLRDPGGAIVGYDFASDDADPMDGAGPFTGHGTHTAGTIAARGNNGLGVTGVCQRAWLMPIKIFNDQISDERVSDVIRAIDFAREHGAQVMNASFAHAPFSQLELEALQRARDAGILFVAAAGNDGRNNDQTPLYPASYNALSDNVLSVAATTRSDTLASFSNFGADSVDLAAPGASVLSTAPNGGYRTMSGTSMAAPHVAGAAALLLAAFPSLTLPQLKARLLAGTDPLAALSGKVATGRLNVARAMASPLPAAPHDLAATATAPTQIELTWQDPPESGDGVEIWRREEGAAFAWLADVVAGAMTFSDAGLPPNSTFTYQVRAITSTGTSAFSNEARATTLPLPGGRLQAPASLDVGRVRRPGTSKRTLVLRNVHPTATLMVNVLEPAAPFALAGGGPASIPPNRSHRVTVLFTPVAAGRASATLTIRSGDRTRPVATVKLVGVGR
jgi:subtilisin family serine protease